MNYDFNKIEKYWQKYWDKHNIFKSKIDNNKKKFYILNMFPYPSGEGLHIGHLLGYIAADIYARYKMSKGYNILNPIGFDSFGLPAEQYAIDTGDHPKNSISKNIKKYKKQLKNIGLSLNWNREILTSDPFYYRWTQWIFIKLFNSWYDLNYDKARPISDLIKIFSKKGSLNNLYFHENFSPKEWNNFTYSKKEKILQNYRLAFKSKSNVNWCPNLNTVLANDEIKNGRSKRGGYIVCQKKITQWNLRITAYAERLLNGLKNLDWPKSIKNCQINWIGKTSGLLIFLKTINGIIIKTFIKNPENIFGVTYIVLSTSNTLLYKLIFNEYYSSKIKNYILKEKKSLYTNNIYGEFTGNYAIHPFTKKKIPIYISNYIKTLYDFNNDDVAIMCIPSINIKDNFFAKKFGLKFIEIFYLKKDCKNNEIKKLKNSYFINNLNTDEASELVIKKVIKNNIGKKFSFFRLKDAVFSRQRYWGEPIPIYYKNGIPNIIPENKLPLLLPLINNYQSKIEGEPPLINSNNWAWDEINNKIVSNKLIDNKKIFPIETSTMPSWAGSSWYFIRYMDPKNSKKFISKKNENYWRNVDLYIGGAEHTTGHLIYSRFFNKFLKDIGYINEEEPFKKLINQGMMLNYSAIIKKDINVNKLISYSKNIIENNNIQELYVDINLIKIQNELDICKFRNWRKEFKNIEIILDKGKFICMRKLEKMSKSKYNVINPDNICKKYGSDTLRLYEMFLGPINQSKIWDINKISGVFNFLRKFWSLFHIKNNFYIENIDPLKCELKILHKTIKNVIEDIENFSFNTSVSSFMILTNELIKFKCKKRSILEPFVILMSPFTPHISECIWKKLGHKKSIIFEKMPQYELKYIKKENIVEYLIMFNGKFKFKKSFDLKTTIEDIKTIILNHIKIKKYLNNLNLKKIIVIPNKVINIITK